MRTLSAAVALALLSGCLSGTTSEYKSKQLEQGLSEGAVIGRLGQPESVSLSTCGGANGIPTWTCKLYKYNNNGWAAHSLTVYFSKSLDGDWHVNNWNVL